MYKRKEKLKSAVEQNLTANTIISTIQAVAAAATTASSSLALTMMILTNENENEN